MKIPRIANAVGYIDDDLVTMATESKKQVKPTRWFKWGSLVACFVLLAIIGLAVFPSVFIKDNATDERYRDFSIKTDEIAIAWPWEYQTVYEKYTAVEIDGVEYLGKGRAVSESLIGENIGNYNLVGYDLIDNGKKYTAEFEVYKLKNVDKSRLVAVKMEERYYAFGSNKYDPPGTLGELMEQVDLSKVVELNRFSENGDSPNDSHFALTNDDYIWNVLADCKNAEFVEDSSWKVFGRNYLSFTVTSEALGVYKVAMYVTEDGYLWTNAFGYRYLFYIGKDASNNIIEFAKENSVQVEYEPYMNNVVGIIEDVTDEYLLLSDSVLCKDIEDAITYKILLNDMRISRYKDYGLIGVGDTVKICYEGEIDRTNTVTNATLISIATIFYNDVLIPE